MSELLIVIIFALMGSVLSLLGGILLLKNRNHSRLLAIYATPFAAGALLAAAFTDLLPEGSHQGDADTALLAAMIGIVGFFLLERFLHWFHHHHHDPNSKRVDPNASLIVVGDSLHNFIDGLAIAAGFLVSVPTGMIATVAVAAHEIPQEIGDFGMLLKKGMGRRGVLKVNLFSAFSTLVGAVTFYQLGGSLALPLDVVLGLVAGFFIYIAASDIIPSIHAGEEKRIAGWQTVMLILGAVVVSWLNGWLHQFIEAEPAPSESHHASARVLDSPGRSVY